MTEQERMFVKKIMEMAFSISTLDDGIEMLRKVEPSSEKAKQGMDRAIELAKADREGTELLLNSAMEKLTEVGGWA